MVTKINEEDFVISWEEGKSIRELADEFGVDSSTIYKKARKLELNRTAQSEKIRDTIKENLKVEPKVDLDFVSFDIETTNLTADFSVLLCACIKPFGREPIVFRADKFNKDWATKRMDDSKITKAIADELMKHAVVITHYGSKFDLPYLKAKMAKYGMTPLPPLLNIDTWRVAKNNFQVSSRRLASLSQYFELGAKSGVEGDLWMQAGMNGCTEALDEIVAHNIQDVILLEKLAALSFPYMKAISKV